MASAVRGMRVVYDKEGIDPCSGDAHYCECVYQRRRRPRGRLHNRTGEDACPERKDRSADAHLKRNARRSVARDGARGGGGGDQGPAWLWHLGAHPLRRIRRPAAEADASQNDRGVAALGTILDFMDCGSGGSQPTDGLCDKKAGAESFILSPGLNCNLEPDSSG